MVKAFPNPLRWRVVMLRRRGLTNNEIAETLCVSERFVRKVNNLYQQTLDVKDPPRRKSKERLITAVEMLLLRDVIEQSPELFLDEIQAWMEHLTGEVFSIPTIDRCMNKMGITLKKMQVIARQRNEHQRATYRRFVSRFRPEQFLFLDESAKDDRTLQRKFARSLGGTRVSRKGNFTRGSRFSVLGAVSIHGVKAAHVIARAFDRTNFEFAVEHFVAPLVGSFANGDDCSIVVLDNCPIHHSPKFLRMIRSKGGIVLYLPPYSPDLNPIEECFSVAKNWLRRHKDISEKNPKRCFEIALYHVQDCAGVFRDCGYV